MARRGMTVLEIIVFVAVLLVAAYLVSLAFRERIVDFVNSNKCTNSGGSCATTCGGDTFPNGATGCPSGQQCCAPVNPPEPGSGTAKTPEETPKPSPIRLPQLQSTSLRVTDASLQSVSDQVVLIRPTPNGGEATIDDAGQIVISGTAPFHDLASNKEPTNKEILVKREDWKIRLVLKAGDVIVEDTKDVYAQKADAAHITLLPTTAADGPQDTMLSYVIEAAGQPVKKSEYEYSRTFKVVVTPHFKEQYAGQTLQLLATVYPGEPGKHPSLERQYKVSYRLVNPIKISGLTQTWAKKKEVTVRCDGMTCTDMFFKIVENPTTCKASDENVAALEYPAPRVKYCLVGTDKNGVGYSTTTYFDSCFDDEDACRARLPQTVSFGEYTGIAQNIGNSVGLPQLSQYGDEFSMFQNEVVAMQCPAIPQLRDITPEQSRGLFKVMTFSRETQTGTITLDQPFMSNKYLCVYGKDAKRNVYFLNSSQRIMTDLTPPVVKVKFDPWKLRLSFTCTDEGGSGCKEAMGVAYISDTSSFLSALGRGPQSAVQWCPSVRSGTYSPETRHDVIYNDNAVRVLCVRGEDQAGNAAVSMITVYNGYDMLAKAIAMAVNQ